MIDGQQTDIIIIGSGFAGLTCAIEALNLGKNVIILEKTGSIGGNSIISDGGIAAPNSHIQQSQGISDNPTIMEQDMLKAGKYLNNPELVRVVCEHALEAFNWTKDYLGVAYLNRVDIFGGHTLPRCYTPVNRTGRTIINAQLKVLRQFNVDVQTHKYIKDFVKDHSGNAIGVEVELRQKGRNFKKTDNVFYYARDAIVVASGGFGSDAELLTKYGDLPQSIQSTNKLSATGEMLKLLQQHGAHLIDMNEIQLGPWASIDEKGYGLGPLFGDYIALPFGVLINPLTSKRFINETADRKTVADAILKINHYALALADYNIVDKSNWDLEKLFTRGILKTYSSLNEIADFYQLNPTTFQDEIARYNQMVQLGIDEVFNKNLTNHTKISTPPYYVMKMFPKVHHTMGGVKINQYGQVIDVNGIVIPKLYAIGEVSGGIHGASRLGSCAVTECIVMGRRAAQHIKNNNT